MSKLYEIVDPRPVAANAKYTYFLPSSEELKLVGPNDLVKLCIRSIPPSEKWDAERMWVKVTTVANGSVEGMLMNDPGDMPELPCGSRISAPLTHVIGVLFEDSEKYQLIDVPDPRTYWERCFVDKEVLDGQLKVGFIHREQPDVKVPEEKYPDSGWRIRGVSQPGEDISARKSAYVALGAVLNQDDSWLHLIDEPIGSEYELDPKLGIFVRATN